MYIRGVQPPHANTGSKNILANAPGLNYNLEYNCNAPRI